jgi:hypothetical protein
MKTAFQGEAFCRRIFPRAFIPSAFRFAASWYLYAGPILLRIEKGPQVDWQLA